MNGGKIAYNLRPNKFVERQLFVELLTKVEKSPTTYDLINSLKDNYLWNS